MRRRPLVALFVLLGALLALSAVRTTTPARAVAVCDAGCSDLSVSVSGPDSGHTGIAIEYDIVVENEGPDGTPDAVLTDTLPVGAALLSLSTTQGTCDDAPAGLLTCDLGPLDYPGIATIALTVLPRTAGSNTNSVSVLGASLDLVPANNTDATTGSMSDGLGSVFTKTGPATAVNNTQITYTLTTKLPNCAIVGGTCTSGSVNVTDTLPTGETFVSVATSPSASNCTTPAVGAGGEVTCNWNGLDILGNATTLTETIVVQLSTSASSITSSASQHDDFFAGETKTASATTALVLPPPAQIVLISGVANLTLTTATTGCGSVTPAGTYAVTFGLNVVLTATPCPGSRFTGWTGGTCAGTSINPCDVAIATATTITANFAP